MPEAGKHFIAFYHVKSTVAEDGEKTAREVRQPQRVAHTRCVQVFASGKKPDGIVRQNCVFGLEGGEEKKDDKKEDDKKAEKAEEKKAEVDEEMGEESVA